MSAICGLLRFDARAAAERDVERMLKAMAHRARDRTRTWQDGAVALGHGLLRSTREDLFDNQPLSDGPVTLVADLRLDNRDELGPALGLDAAAAQDLPDSAFLLHAYKMWGSDCAEHLLGDFAFALWDGDRRRLVLGRDHMGQRDVYFHRGADFFAFSTELKGLWALGEVPRTHDGLEPRPWAEPGRGGSERTTNILAGGTVMTVAADGRIATQCYWEPRADPAHQGHDEAYYVAAYRKVLGEAVACRLRRANRSAGLLFSGGFDSGAIAALAGPIVTAQGRKLVAAASVMPEDYRGSIRHARRWTEICRRHMPHLDMRYITREGRDILTGLEKSFLTTDGRLDPNHYVNDALYEAVAAAGARVVMDGHGGDYTLNVRGFPWLVDLLGKGRLRTLAAEFRAFRRHSGTSFWQAVRGELLWPLLPHRFSDLRMRLRHRLALFGPAMPYTEAYRQNANRDDPQPPPRSGAQMRRRLREMLGRKRKARSAALPAALHGLDFTRPFHDKRVIELGLAIPESLWVRHGRERHLARLALKDLYPPEYQKRARGNDDIRPDSLAMIRRAEARLLAEIDRMEAGGKLSRYFDFPRMRRMLTSRRIEDHNSGSEGDVNLALLAFLSARYMEWFRREN